MKRLVLSILFVLQVLFAFAQQTSGITGTVIDSKTQKPLQSVLVSVQNTNTTKITDNSGKFLLANVAAGEQLVRFQTEGYTVQYITVNVPENEIVDLNTVFLEEDITSELQLSLVTITENDLGDDNSGSESTSGLLQASRDAFLQAAAFNFGQARFRVRGLDNEYGSTMINGVNMSKLYDGRPQWSNWGGLNDATRNQEFTNGSAPVDYTFGGILGTQTISTRASIYRPGTRVSVSGANTNYNWRTMATHASGMNQNGWAYVISASYRGADEAHFEGTTYDAKSLFASVEKRFNDRHSLNFTSIYAQNSRGKNSPNTEEMSDLAGVRYNSYWGYQDGKIRNSRVKRVEEPIFMLSHYWNISQKTKLNTNVSYQFGEIGNSRLDFQGVDNPDPTYYRNLPSYYTTYHNNGVWTPNYPMADMARENFMANRQINWTNLYAANSNPDLNGRSVYALYEDRMDDKNLTFNTYLASQLSDNIILNAGANVTSLRSDNFQNMIDLLGGSYFSDIDPFFMGSQSQADLNNPDREIGVGDRYGYNYRLLANTYNAFTQFKFTYNKVDFYLAQSFSRSEYQRDGLYKNGIYPTNSYGKSDKVNFENFGFKGGLTYKISGRHLLDFNAVRMTKAPTLRNTFSNARLNNNITPNLSHETVTSLDASYIIRTPNFKSRLTGYFSQIQDATEVSFFYAEGLGTIAAGNDGNLFVSEIITDLDKRNIGAELGLEWQISKTVKATGAAAYGQYIYTSNPNVSLNIDNLVQRVDFGNAKMKNYRQAGMPQQAYSLGLEYRDPNFWWVGANVNYLDDNYLDVSMLMRTDNFFLNPDDPTGLSFADATEEAGRELLKQEKFDSFFLVNLQGGKSWRTSSKNRNTIGFFASVNNVLDVTYKTGGFEQGRNANFQQVTQDYAGGVRSFGPKYFYGYGRTYFVNLYYNF